MQAPSDNGASLTVPLAPWETIKRPLDSENAPDTVSNSPKRSCTPENTFSSGRFSVPASKEGTSAVDPAAGTTPPLNLGSEFTYNALPETDTAMSNFIHQPEPTRVSSSNQATRLPHSSQLTTQHDEVWNQVYSPLCESIGFADDRPGIVYSRSQKFETTESFMDNEYRIQGNLFPDMDDITLDQQLGPPEDSSGNVYPTGPNTEIPYYPGPMETEMGTTKRESKYEGHPEPMAILLDETAPRKSLDIFVPSTDVIDTIEHDNQLGAGASKPFKSCNFEGQAVSKPIDDEDRSLTNFDTCLGLVRLINRNHCQKIQY